MTDLLKPDVFWGAEPAPERAGATVTDAAGTDPLKSLTVIAVIAPFPLASNFPAAWLAWSALVGLAWLRAPVSRTGHDLSPTQSRLIWITLLIAGFAILQAAAGLLPLDLGFLPNASHAPTATLLAATRIMAFALILNMLFATRRAAPDYVRMGEWLFWGIVIHALLALLRLYVFPGDPTTTVPTRYLNSASGGFVSPNAFAMQTGFGLMLGLAYLEGRTGWVRNLHLLAIAVLTAALFATQSRLGIVSVTAASIVVAVMVPGRMVVVALAVSGIIFIAAAGFIFGSVGARLPDLAGAFSDRTELYAQVAELIAANLFGGVGLDAFASAFPTVHKAPVTAGFIWEHTHSTYLTLWAEAGIMIGSLPILASTLAAAELLRRIKSLPRGPARVLPVAALAALVQAALHSLFDFALEVYANTLTLSLLVAMALAPVRTRVRKKGANP